MPSTPKPTRKRLVEAAHGLFYSQGFHGVGLDQVIDAAGVTKTTFYNHFQSKDDLILEVLREHDMWWRRAFQQMLRERGGDDPRDQIECVFDALHDVMNNDDFHGCIFINVAVEFPIPHDPAHLAAQENKRAIEMVICDLAARAGAADPMGFAREFTLIMEGAYVTFQVSRNEQTTAIAGRVARTIIDRHLPPRN